MKTYWSLDICELSHKLKQKLCHDILKREPFDYYRNSDEAEPSNESSHSIDVELHADYQIYSSDSINRACSRRKVNLGNREVDSLKAQYFSMWQCPKAKAGSGYSRVYHITKCYLKNSVLFFKTCDICENEHLLFPNAVATGIDREDLVRMVLND